MVCSQIVWKGFHFEKCGTNSESCVMLVPVYVLLPRKNSVRDHKKKKKNGLTFCCAVSLRWPHKLRSVVSKKSRDLSVVTTRALVFLFCGVRAIAAAACVRKPWFQAQVGIRPAQTSSAPSSTNPFAARTPTCGSRAIAAAAWPASSVVRAAVGAVTELLRALSPAKKPSRDDAVEELDPPPYCAGVEDVLAVLEDDYRRAYFLTGRSRYAQNLDLLVPFFDSPSLELENIEKGSRVETKFIKTTWILRTYLRLPWRPLVAIRGNTTYDLNEDYKVTRHSESWDVSALQIFVSAREQNGN